MRWVWLRVRGRIGGQYDDIRAQGLEIPLQAAKCFRPVGQCNCHFKYDIPRTASPNKPRASAPRIRTNASLDDIEAICFSASSSKKAFMYADNSELCSRERYVCRSSFVDFGRKNDLRFNMEQRQTCSPCIEKGMFSVIFTYTVRKNMFGRTIYISTWNIVKYVRHVPKRLCSVLTSHTR